MYSSVFFLVFLCICGSLCQEDEVAEITTDAPLSTVVCSACACENGIVDCNSRGLTKSFTFEDWEGLKNSNVTQLDLSGNSLDILTQFSELPVQILNISNSKVEKIVDGCFKYLQELATLDLSNNQIMSLDKRVFSGLMIPTPDQSTMPQIKLFAKMRSLSLAYNELHTLPKDAFNFMPDITFLDVSENPLGIIDQVVMGTLSDLRSLKELRLSGCQLDTLPAGLFRRLQRLERLDISNNRFTTLPSDVLGEAVNLISLNFDRNLITSLEEVNCLAKLTKLRELSICRNTKLQSIGPGALGGLENLVTLSICNNLKLSILDDDFLTWYDDDDDDLIRRPLVQELYLNNNNLTEIDPDFVLRWDQLRKMDFSDNPFLCDCTNQWMVDVLVPFMIEINASATNMLCNNPQEMRGMSFAQLYQNSKTLTCPVAEAVDGNGPETAIVLGVMIGIFTTFPLVLILVLLWKRGVFAKCRGKMNSEGDSDDEHGAL